MVRRSVAAGAGVLVLILLLFGLKGCLDARKERAYKDYVRDVAALTQESNTQGEQLFGLLANPGETGSDVDIENALNGFRVQSEQLVDRAAGTDHPDELDDAHRYLIQALEFRRDGVRAIADALPNIRADEGDRRASTEQVAGSMQSFLASDVIFQTRVRPGLEEGLRSQDLQGEETVPQSSFIKDLDYLQPDVVAERVGSGGGTAAADGEAAPGLHGNGLGTVTLGGQALAAGGSASVTLSDDLQFEIQVANQGENTETDVQVNVTVGEGGDAIELDKLLDEIAAGETKTVEIPLTEQPPTGQSVPISVEVEPVLGEEKTDNNSGEFSAIFTR